jgi:hypothetical protein
MRSVLFWLALPAVVMIVFSRLGTTPKIPKFLAPFFRWFYWVGHITLSVYCVLVAFYAIFGLRLGPRTQLEIVAQIAIAIVMVILAGSFWRSAKRAQ